MTTHVGKSHQRIASVRCAATTRGACLLKSIGVGLQKIEPVAVKGACKYYGAAALKKLQNAAKK